MQYVNTLKILILIGLISSNLSVNMRSEIQNTQNVSRAPFFDDNTINLLKIIAPLAINKDKLTDAQFSNSIGRCITQLREKRKEYLSILRNFWESMRKIYDKRGNWNNNIWTQFADNLLKFNVALDNQNINCSNFFKNMKTVDESKLYDVLKGGEFFGSFNQINTSNKSQTMITGIIGTRRSLLDKNTFQRINRSSRGN